MTAPRTIEIHDGGPHLVVDVYDAATPRGAVLCVHGFASSRKSAKIETLGARLPALGYTVIAPDLQGHGDSGGDFEGLTVSRSIDDVRRVARFAEFASADVRLVVGSSFGGLVASWTAAEDRRLCHGVLLIAPAFGYLDRYLPELDAEERAAWIAGRPHAIEMEHRTVRLGNGVLAERTVRSVARLAPALRGPTLIVHGTADESVPWEASREFADAHPRDDLELVLLDAADHGLSRHLHVLGDLAERFLQGISGGLRGGRN